MTTGADRGAGVEPVPGLLIVDKPTGWTSHDVVGRVRRLAGTRKVGHAGTLDPMATGVLVVGIGRATRLLTYIVGHDKAYDATVRLGVATVTDDAEGNVTTTADASGLTRERIDQAVAALSGDILQVPSAVSAIKVDGKRAYAKVRAGDDVEIAPRPVTVSAFDIDAIRPHGHVIDLDVHVKVSSGTYVRALARDLGEALGVGGHLTALRRTRVGGLSLDTAHSLDELTAIAEQGEQLPLMALSAAASAVLPTIEVDRSDATALGFGQQIASAGMVASESEGPWAVIADDTLVAVVDRRGDRLKPAVVFQPSVTGAPSSEAQ